jgi:hypothetical protein
MQINTTTVELLFNLVFISQIILLSWYYPKTIINRINRVMKKYPASDYPKLYLKPQSYYLNKLEQFRNTASFALIMCFIVVLLSWSMGNSANEEMLIFICFAIQMLPIMILAFTSAKHYQNMKKAHKTNCRSASLQPRKLFDFVSPSLVGLAAVLFIAFMFIFLQIHNFELTQTNVLITFVGAPLLQIYFIGMVLWKMHGRKQNPLVSESDRIKEIKTVAKIAVYASIAASVFLMTSTVMDEFIYLDSLDPMILSLYLQLITIFSIGTEIRSIKIDEFDFEVYKNDISITPHSTSV